MRGARWEGGRSLSSPCAFYFYFLLLLFLLGYPAGASAEERETAFKKLRFCERIHLFSVDGWPIRVKLNIYGFKSIRIRVDMTQMYQIKKNKNSFFFLITGNW